MSNLSSSTHVMGLDTALPQPDPARQAGQPLAGLRVAYLMNQHPMTSTSFVRREMAGLESAGAIVERFSIRRWEGATVDPADEEEIDRTNILLVGWFRLLWDGVCVGFKSPTRFLSTLWLSARLGWKSDRGLLRYLIYFVEACRLARLLNAQQLPWVHAHFGTNSTTVAMFSYLLGGPRYSFTVHGPEEFDRPELLHLETKIKHAALVIAISNYGRSQLFRWSRYQDWKKIQIVRCGINDSFVCPTDEPSGSPEFTCVARLAEQKGLPVLIQAAGELKQRGRDVHFSIIGDGPMRGEIESLIEHFDVADTVTLLGWRGEAFVRDAIANARALVLPSFAEGLPVVIMEALALERPVITTHIAGIPELVKHGTNGWLVPAGDACSLVMVIESALEASPERLHEMGKAGAASVHRFHLASREAVRLGEMIRHVLTSTP